MPSSTDKGDAFRDLVSSHLSAGGFAVTNEVHVEFKNVDSRNVWSRDDLDGPVSYLIEAKHYEGTLPLAECVQFAREYGELVRRGHANRAWLISSGQISPNGRAAIEQDHQLRCFTMSEFQRNLMRLDGYLRDLVARYDEERIGEYYVPPHTEQGLDLLDTVREWICEPGAPPLAVVSGYGKGKSTFAKHLAATLAREALDDNSKRVPVLMPLGEVLDEIAIDGLLGRVFSSRHRAINYHFHLFKELNRTGRFLVILDGFDEMKHGMTIATFERAFSELMKLDTGEARVLILGRDTAFHNDAEFRSLILGRQTTTMGRELPARDRRPCRSVGLRDFTEEEVHSYVERYFRMRAQPRGEAPSTASWVDERVSEILAPRFSDLIMRPVHAQMLCEVATDPTVSLHNMTRSGLYDAFVHYLLDREVKKHGRDPAFPAEIRRRFNASVAWWLWERGGASTTTLDTLPTELCKDVVADVSHNYDATGLKRELTAGLLVEKNKDTIYFGHRSIQEFLVAEHLFSKGLDRMHRGRGDIAGILRLLNPDTLDFLLPWFSQHGRPSQNSQARELATQWIETINGIRSNVYPKDIDLYYRLAILLKLPRERFRDSSWMYWLGYFIGAGRLDFEIGRDRLREAISYLKMGFRYDELKGSSLVLLACLLLSNRSVYTTLLPEVVGAWLAHPEFFETMEEVRNRSTAVYVKREDRPLLWYFLRCTLIGRSINGEISITITPTNLFNNIVEIVHPTLLVDRSQEEFVAFTISCSVQSVYRALPDLSERNMEQLRRFFNDENLRQRVKPLIVERRSKRLPIDLAARGAKIGE